MESSVAFKSGTGLSINQLAKSKRAWIALVFLVWLTPLFAADLIPASRRTIWQNNVGVPGGIPSRATIYTTLSPSGGDDTSAIQTALDNCPADQVVKLTAGTFKLSTSSSLNIRHRTVLRGHGDSTVLHCTGDAVYAIQFYGPYEGWMNIDFAAKTSASKGDTQVTLGAVRWADQIAVGRKAFFYQDNDTSKVFAGYNGGPAAKSQTQWVNITGWNANTGVMAFEPALYADYSTECNPGVRTIYAPGLRNQIEYAGLEDVKIVNTRDGRSANVLLSWASYCWVKGVTSKDAGVCHIWLWDSFRCEIRESTIEGIMKPFLPGRGYGIQFGTPNNPNPPLNATAALVEDNIFKGTRGNVLIGYGSSGGAIAYNYFHSTFYEESTILLQDIVSHSSFPHMWLIEGNIGHSITLDNTGGNSHWMTIHRNWWRGKGPATTSQLVSVEADMYNRYTNVTGNILGYKGIVEDVAALTSPSGRSLYDVKAPEDSRYSHFWRVYMLGYATPGGSITPHDTQVAATMLRKGNFNYVDAAVPESESLAGETLPLSYLYASKPHFFKELTWPPLGPDRLGVWQPALQSPIIPAQARYFGIWAPAPPAGLRIKAPSY